MEPMLYFFAGTLVGMTVGVWTFITAMIREEIPS